jgi:hypothetical protein
MHEAFLAEAPSPWSLVLVAVALCLLVLFSLWINGAVGRSTPAGRVQSLVSLKNKLSKVPDHLAVAYDGDDKQGLDHLLCWAWFCNIRRVTVFDSKGKYGVYRVHEEGRWRVTVGGSSRRHVVATWQLAV